VRSLEANNYQIPALDVLEEFNLDNRDSFVRWVHFVHNTMNVKIGKVELPFVPEKYREEYQSKPMIFEELRVVLILGLM
jgi:hypothetical protein